jgi:hypothetical protein
MRSILYQLVGHDVMIMIARADREVPAGNIKKMGSWSRGLVGRGP